MDKYLQMFKEGMTKEEFSNIIEKVNQASADKIRTEYSIKIKELEGQIPQEKDPKMVELENRLNAMETKEKSLAMKESLLANGLPVELGNFVNVDTDIEKLKGVFGEMKLNNSFKPQEKNQNSNNGMTKEEFGKLDYNGRSELFTSNPELYTILSK